MTDAGTSTRWTTPELGARAVSTMLLYFRKHYGRERLERLWLEEQLPLPIEHVENLSNYVSVAFAERLMDALVKGSGDPRFLERAWQLIATPEGIGWVYYLLRGLGTPLSVYKKTIELSPTYNRVGEFTVESSSDTELTLRYHSKIPERDRSLCISRMAQFAAFPTIWDLPEAKIEELQCQVKGADSCRYHFSWHNPPPLGWRWLLGAGLGVAAGTGVALLALPTWPAIAGLSVCAGFLGGAWLDARRLAGVKDDQLRAQDRGLTRSLSELQKRADEIFKANVELDQRVNDRTRDLQAALARLEQLDRLKSEFFANVSHELRTPLTLISTPIEARLAEPMPEVERELLEGVRRNAHRLLRLIDDLLDLSRIDAGHLRLSVVPVDLSAMARQLETVYALGAKAKGIALLVAASEPTPEVYGDLHRLDSVVSNLLGNALKYTPDGGAIAVTVTQTEHEARVAVADTGRGIAPDDLPRIFDRYYQASGAHSRPTGGVGIGLSLAKNLAELHGGRIEVSSSLDKGSTFTLVLKKGREHFAPEVVERRQVRQKVAATRRAGDLASPADAPATLKPVVPSEFPDLVLDGGRKARVLVVEDNDEVRAMLKDILAPHFVVLLARDGQEGLATANRERPELVLTDVMMPNMTGTELCAAIKKSPTLKSTPVVMLTARGGAESALDGFASGADEFVEKPFHPRVLVARVAAQLRLKVLTLQLATQARLAAVGSLAAGVGHEVRNPVNAVLNGVRVLMQQENVGEESRALLGVIADGAQRIERISGALLGHARPGDQGGAKPIDVREGLDATLKLLDFRLGGVEVQRDYRTSAKVVASAAELNQVFLNLLDNGLRAPAKKLWLRVAEEGANVRVAVEDDGPGIAVADSARIFDAFYTTRQPGQGTGLGLYLSREIVQKWGGTLTFHPRDGGGAAFVVELPKEAV